MNNAQNGTNADSFENRPWGSFAILDEHDKYKVKRLEILPNKRLSYQKHTHRDEHWFVVQGSAKVTLNGDVFLVETGSAVDIRRMDAHRIENPSESETVIMIEVQTGDYFGEDDIERLEDDFGRSNG